MFILLQNRVKVVNSAATFGSLYHENDPFVGLLSENQEQKIRNSLLVEKKIKNKSFLVILQCFVKFFLPLFTLQKCPKNA